ncbi:cytochrome o ubiquinol oxidase subunit III [Buchnera aphidicola (Cinara tujafilina)]|uniref:Cytochrome o ubiquinol oxidase subunit III n=1 Tax=Buchnera aphidicola (Cinara tujafilina) TaxID=261317 RepID=F7WZK7_9GAMM|nr:cytochrome c oxidase subunit 3 [Buchnera aphidicola]AEH39874.1 cytochrome o ubiquinol oxidase subunit III [Buchnera aphidicola (Cinara tujafilina)]
MIKKMNVQSNTVKKIVDTSGQQELSTSEENSIFGFWIYLMSDCIIFAVLLIVFLFMSNYRNDLYFFKKKIFSLSLVFLETTILLLSSLTCKMATTSLNKKSIKLGCLFLLNTLFLGILFVFFEFREFSHLLSLGFNPTYHGCISSFFVLLGFHFFHVIIGILWLVIILLQIFFLQKIKHIRSSLLCFNLFWHFLDIMWIILILCIYL